MIESGTETVTNEGPTEVAWIMESLIVAICVPKPLGTPVKFPPLSKVGVPATPVDPPVPSSGARNTKIDPLSEGVSADSWS